MATTKEQQEKNQQDFAASFGEDQQAAPEQTEDQAFGITPEDGANSPGEDGDVGNAPAVAIVIPEEGAAAEEAAETPAEQATEGAAGEAAEEMPPMSQNDKTWDGRLRKREEEIAAREQALSEKEKAGVTESHEESGEVGGDADGSESGLMSAEEAMQKLSEDFGPDFVQMIVAIATSKAKEEAMATAGQTVQAVSQNVEAIIAHLNDAGQRDHFKAINGAHPDFMDVANSPEFQQWLSTRPTEEQENDKRILASGNADEIIDILHQFKKAGEPQQDDGADDAEGVRGGGIQLPNTPAASGDYEEAWNQA